MRGNRTTYTHDGNDRLTSRRYPDGSRHTFTFDAVGNRRTMQDGTGRYTTMWDALSRMQTTTTPHNQRITYAWDAIGQRRSMIAPTGGRFTYQYDAAGRITSLRNPENDRTTFAYDNSDRRTVKYLANGTRASFTYDAADQATGVWNIKSDGTPVCAFDYRYDPAGNRTGVTETATEPSPVRVTWIYDATNQLTAERRSGTNAYAQTFTYDPTGNRLVKNADGTRATTTYDAANQIQYSVAAAGRTTYTFDANGNQQVVQEPTDDRTTSIWGFENQPLVYQLPDSTRVTATYNPDNRRVEKRSDSATTRFAWDQQNDSYLLESDNANAPQIVYTAEPIHFGRTISQRRAGTTSIYELDVLGTIRAATAGGGIITDTASYDAWGVPVAQTGINPLSFGWVGESGYYSDSELGAYWVRERHLEGKIARWNTFDPIQAIIGHDYIYGFNNPLRFLDPSGRIGVQYSGERGWGVRSLPGPCPTIPAGELAFVRSGFTMTRDEAIAIKKAYATKSNPGFVQRVTAELTFRFGVSDKPVCVKGQSNACPTGEFEYRFEFLESFGPGSTDAHSASAWVPLELIQKKCGITINYCCYWWYHLLVRKTITGYFTRTRGVKEISRSAKLKCPDGAVPMIDAPDYIGYPKEFHESKKLAYPAKPPIEELSQMRWVTIQHPSCEDAKLDVWALKYGDV